MKVIFLPVAKKELDQAIEFYEEQLTGLGVLFHGVIDNIIIISAVAHQHRHPRSYLHHK